MKEWNIDIKKDREVFVDGQKLNTYGIQLEKEIKILSKKGPKHNKKINHLRFPYRILQEHLVLMRLMELTIILSQKINLKN